MTDAMFLSNADGIAGLAILIGGSTAFGVLEWRGIVRTPWDNARPGSAAASFAIALVFAVPLLALAVISVVGPIPDDLRGPVAILGVLAPMLLSCASLLYLFFTSTPPRWTVPPRLHGALEVNRARKRRRR